MSAPTDSPPINRRDIGLRSERGPVLLAVMLSVGLVAIDATILAAAVPAVVDDLGGLTQFPWLFSVYLLTQAVSVPLYSKLADQFGRKPVMLVGVGLFVVGSLLCGVAWNMGALIAFRAVQGLGAGAVQPVAMTIVGDIYTLQERAKVQGYVASVWALSSLVGPTLGGIFADYVSWRWIFLVNLPIGAAAMWMFVRRFTDRPRDNAERPRIDYLGSALLSVGGVVLLLALLEGGVRWAWASPVSIALFAVALVCVVAFVLVERRAAEPVLPLWVFRSRVLVAAMAGSLVVGVLLLGLTSYVPLFAQGVLGHGAVVSGLALAAMTMGWPIAAATAGRFYLTIGFRATVLMGAAIVVVGGLLLLTVTEDSSIYHLGAVCFVLGIGFGYAVSPAVIAAQSSVAFHHRGVATGTTLFARSIGSALGVAAFGAVANAIVARDLGHSPDRLEGLDPGVLAPAIQAVFLGSAAVAVLLLAASFLMPSRIEEQR